MENVLRSLLKRPKVCLQAAMEPRRGAPPLSHCHLRIGRQVRFGVEALIAEIRDPESFAPRSLLSKRLTLRVRLDGLGPTSQWYSEKK